MSALINNTVAGLMIAILAIGLFWNAAVREGTLPPEVRDVRAQWLLDAQGPTLVAALDVVNPGKIRAEIARIDYQAELNGAGVDAGAIHQRATLLPGQATSVRINLPVPAIVAEQWWDGWIRGNDMVLRLHGTLNATAGRHEVQMPFDWTARHAGAIPLLDDVETVCGRIDLPCVRGIETGAIHDPRTMPLTLSLQAPDYTRAEFRHVRVALALGGVIVAEASSSTYTVSWGSPVDIPLLLKVSSDALASWWPTHLQRCEESPVQLTTEYQVTLTNWTSTRETRVAETVPGEIWRTPLLCEQSA